MSTAQYAAPSYSRLRVDFILIVMTGVLAGCGLIYEYLLAHYAARVLGAVETVIFTIISLMIVSMGVGSFLSGRIRDPFRGLVFLELGMVLSGSLAVLFSSGLMAGTFILPQVVAETLRLPAGLDPKGGIFGTLTTLAQLVPYGMACVLGTLIGMEIPLIARIRETLHARHIANNIGTIYGADYIGAGIGAVVWVGWMLAIDPALAGALTAMVNLAVGLTFICAFYREIKAPEWLIAGHGILFAIVLAVIFHGASWQAIAEDTLYADRVVYHHDTHFQRLVVTERQRGPGGKPLLTFHINGRVQFSSHDEEIYHAMLVTPAMMASARHEKVLIIGGGDGLALRDVLKWNPEEVLLLDLDPELVEFFSKPDPDVDNRVFLEMNRHAFSDPRVKTRYGDAWLTIEELIAEGRRFDTVLVDLPDPNHPDLNKLYSTGFYAKLRQVLAGDGALAVQSTSPYHAKRTFLSIGKTIEASGFASVEQYHANVPSFGEWGWTIATPHGQPPRARIAGHDGEKPNSWASKEMIMASFVFGRGFFDSRDAVEINRPRSTTIYRYHLQDWQEAAF